MAAEDCAGCKKKVTPDEAYCAYECRKGHAFYCCTVQCLRAYEKKCGKVSDACRKLQQKLNNEGQAPALRRVQPTEREKLKQYFEAEKAKWMVCPQECATGPQCILPYCCYVLRQTKTPPGDDEGKSKDLDKEKGGTDKEKISLDIVSDDMLLELKKPEDEPDVPDGGRSGKNSKKAQKAEKNKKGQKLILDFKAPPITAENGESDQTEAPRPGGNAWNLDSQLETTKQQPPLMQHLSLPEKAQRVERLKDTTGCSDERALELLEGTGWNLNAAAEVYLGQDQDNSQPRWGFRAEQPAAARQTQPTPAAAEPAPVIAAPVHPPPPPLPPDWVALWCEAEDAYYFWHKPTNHTTWDIPELGTDESTSREPAQSQRSQAEEKEEKEKELVNRLVEITGTDADSARELLQTASWNLQNAIAAHAEQEERRKEARQAEEARKEAERKAALEFQRRAEEAKEAARRASREKEIMAKLGTRICTRHWQPRPGVSDRCIRLFHGERVEVTWAAEENEGWAYGHAVDDSSKEGYFPQAILAALERKPRQRNVGDSCGVSDRFQAPEEIGGYLTVGTGDLLKVLHPLDPPFVWAYVGRVVNEDGNPTEMGWVPECILTDLPGSLKGLRGGPQPAG